MPSLPLHPMIVHLPIALAVLVPAIAMGALWFIRRGRSPRVAWAVAMGFIALQFVSGWAALQTGQVEEERVEEVVAESAIETHEEAAEAFVVLSGIVLVIAAAGLLPNRTGRFARVAAGLGTLVLVGAGYRVGHSGGTLVYREGAGLAYGATDLREPSQASEETRQRPRDDDDH